MFVRGDISILVPDLFRCVVAILTAPAVAYMYLEAQIMVRNMLHHIAEFLPPSGFFKDEQLI
jgi:hypothetical protein